MADTFTTTTGNWSPFLQTAFDRSTAWYLNDQVFFRSLVDKRPVQQAMPGKVVTLSIYGQLAAASSPLTETADVDAVAMPAPRQLSVTLNEYGNVVSTTQLLEKTAFTGTVVQDVAQEIATNMVESIDPLYRTALDGAANVHYVNNTGAVTGTDPTTNTSNINAKAVGTEVAMLRGRKAPTRDGVNYLAYIHPDVSFDLRVEAGSAWVAAHTQVDTGEVYRGEIGTFMGSRFIETPRARKVTGTPNVYTTYFLAREGLVEATGVEPEVRVGPVTDHLSRFRPIGWYALLGVSRYRENCIQLLKTASSIGSLAGAYDPKA